MDNYSSYTSGQVILSPTTTPTPTWNPYVAELNRLNTTLTVNAAAEAVASVTTGNFAGFYRHFGVSGKLQSGTGYNTGYSNRNVFSVDLVDIGGLTDLAMSVGSEATESDGWTKGLYFRFARTTVGAGVNWDVFVRWRYFDGISNQFQEVQVLTNKLKADLYATYQIEFYNPVYSSPSILFGRIEWEWKATIDGLVVANSSATNPKASWEFLNYDLCNLTGITVTGQDVVNPGMSFTVDNFGIGLNGDLSCLPSPVPPP